MLVKDWMTRIVIHVDIEDSVRTAVKMLIDHNIRSLPVMEKGKIIGIISSEDIKRALFSDSSYTTTFESGNSIDKLTIREVARENPAKVSAFCTIDEVADILLKTKLSCVLVIDENEEIAGIVTESDIYKVLVSLTGFNKREYDFGFQVADVPGSIKEITDIMRSHGGRIASILISYDQVPEGYRNVYIRAYQIQPDRLNQIKRELYQKTVILYLFDYLKPSKTIF